MPYDDIQDILGISHTKLGFFQEWQVNLEKLRAAHAESERQRLSNAAIIEGITDLMMVLDEDMRILSVNKVFTELFPNVAYEGEHCFKLFRRGDTPCPECPAFQSLKDNSVFRDSAIFQLNGRHMHFDMVASPLPHPSGTGRAVLMLKRDVTREKRLQAQIYQSEKMASIGTLAAGVAHEINNPLTAITGFAEGIRRRIGRMPDTVPQELAADLSEYTNIILQECNRCRDIVQALMNFSRPLPSRMPVRLDMLVDETLSLLRHTLKRSERVVFCLDMSHDLPEIWVDDTQVRQVLLNLVTNALDALGLNGQAIQGQSPGGNITIRTFSEGEYVALQVEDTGSGIQPQYMETVFEPFFTTKSKGLGLGLSVCYSVVQAHGGDISLKRSRDGKTTVTVRLPLQGQSLARQLSEYSRGTGESKKQR